MPLVMLAFLALGLASVVALLVAVVAIPFAVLRKGAGLKLGRLARILGAIVLTVAVPWMIVHPKVIDIDGVSIDPSQRITKFVEVDVRGDLAFFATLGAFALVVGVVTVRRYPAGDR